MRSAPFNPKLWLNNPLFDDEDSDWESFDYEDRGAYSFRIGSGRADDLRGKNGNDVLVGLGGDDRICGGKGNDIILSGSGNDFVDGGRGNDLLVLGSGDDVAWGGDGNDVIIGGDGNDVIWGGRGRDVISAGAGSDTIVVKAGDWKDWSDTDLLLSPLDDILVFDLSSDIESIRFVASAFAHSGQNEITGSVFTYAAVFENGEMVGEADADLTFVGTAPDPLTLATSLATVGDVDVTAVAGVLGAVPSDALEVFGRLFVTVATENGKQHSYATDFRGDEGDFAFRFSAPNGMSYAEIVWDETGFAISSQTQATMDMLIA